MFKEELKLVPHLPGSYQMFNKDGIIIYVGKAKDLNKRLHSYFRGTVTGKTALMVSEVDHFEYIVTKTETESFVLELNLIKKYDPKYNILLKDDKTYPYIEYTKYPYPTLKVVRYTKVKKSKDKYLFGPYPNSYAARRIVNLINRVYPLKKCDGKPNKVCLYYHIGECLGYCQKSIDENKLKIMEDEILSFLRGNDKVLIDKLNEKIKIFSDNLNFEKAKELHEELNYISVIMDKQKVEIHDYINRDIFAWHDNNGYLSIQIFFIRNGKLLGSHSNIINMVSDKEEHITSYIYSFYQNHEIPKEILTLQDINNEELEKALETRVYTPEKGNKKQIVDMCYMNALLNLEREITSFINSEKRTVNANNRLKELLNLDYLNVIESFDNSNLFGTYSVSGMVVFKNGLPSRKDYRKFKITLDKNDDYSMMQEVIYRRYYRLLIEHKQMPDLIIVDGGINQINACLLSLEKLGLNIAVCGLKKDEHHRTKTLMDAQRNIEIDLTNEMDVFNYLTRIQDEVHRFTINYHKEIRSKGSISSVLSNVDGIGDKRVKLLLKKFGSIKKIKEASNEEINEILPSDITIKLKEFLENIN